MPFALALTVVLTVLTAFQVALAAGAPLGRYAWGGGHRVLPARLRIGSAISIVVYAFIATVAWTRLGVQTVLPELFAQIAMWVVFGYFCLGVLLNAASRSTPERNVMTPVCLVLAALSLCIALGMGALARSA